MEHNQELIIKILAKHQLKDSETLEISKSIFAKLTDEEIVLVAGSHEDKNKFDAGIKAKIIKNLQQNGIVTAEKSGSLSIFIEKVFVLEEIGKEIASDCFSRKGGDLIEELIKKYSGYKALIDHTKQIIDLTNAKAGIKSFEKDNQGYKLKPGKTEVFELCQNTTEFVASPRNKSEEILGEQICNDLKQQLDLDFIQHTQTGRKGAKRENTDFFGLNIRNGIHEDQIDYVTVELKANNRISSIQEAIIQATNYQKISNIVYIAIPNFEYDTFYNEEKLFSLIAECKDKNIGIISISIENNSYKGMRRISTPQRIDNPNIPFKAILEFLDSEERLVCPLCRRIAMKNGDGCKWKDSENNCMRIKLESFRR